MAKEWIEKIAHAIKHKDHDAALLFIRQERVKAILAERVPRFCTDLLQFLQNDCLELVEALAGDPTANPIFVSQIGNSIQVNRANFPFVQANINWNPVGALQVVLRKAPRQANFEEETSTLRYRFEVSDHDGMTLHEADGAQPKLWERPDSFAKDLMELFFQV